MARTKASVIDLGAVVDELGELRVRLDEMRARETVLRDVLLATGRDAIDGSAFRASISTATRSTIDVGAARRELGADWCAAHSSTSATRSIRLSLHAEGAAKLREAA